MKRLTLCLLVCLLWRTALAQTPSLPIDGISETTYPRVNGSTSTIPLGQLLAARLWGYDAELRRIRPSRFDAAGGVQLAFPLEAPFERVEQFWAGWYRNAHAGTHEAYIALAQGQADLILVARPPTREENDLAAARKTTYDARPVALDALVFVVNAKNPVSSLTQAQLKSVFTGGSRLWRVLGGPDWPILAITRNPQSGSQELIEDLLLPGQTVSGAETMTRVNSMGEIIDRVAANENAIGYSVYYYERFMAPRRANKAVAIDGVSPTRESIAARTYPFVAPVYVVTRAATAADSPAARLRDWLLSAAGQRLIADSGYVPIK